MDTTNKPKIIKNLGTRPTAKNGKQRRTFYLVECSECKKHFEIVITSYNRRKTSFCFNCSNKISSTTHGDRKTRLYRIFKNMHNRCYNKNIKTYKDYGAKGIIISQEWKDYLTFKKWALENHYDDTLTIDRIDNNGNYTPENCRWVSFSVQNANQGLKKSITGYTGVYKSYNIYRSQVIFKGKVLFRKFGFKTAIDAAKAREKFIIDNNLPHRLNFY